MGTVVNDHRLGAFVDVLLDGDPFDTYLAYDRIEVTAADDLDNPMIAAVARRRGPVFRQVQAEETTMTTRRSNEGTMGTKTKSKSKSNVRELRREAKALGVRGYLDMDPDELAEAVAKKQAKANKGSKSSKGADKAKKGGKSTKKAKSGGDEAAEVHENGNPFKSGTMLFFVTEELLKGGKRSDMVKRLKKKIEVKPRDGRDIDEDYEIDRRVLITAQNLENHHGFTKEREGRGRDAKIKVTAPS